MQHVKKLSVHFIASLCSLLMLSSVPPSFAGSGHGDHGKEDIDIRHLGDGAFEYDTVDPFGNPVTVVEDPRLDNPVDHSWDDPASENFRGFEVEEADKFPNSFTFPTFPSLWTTVKVYAVADEEYRARHSDWVERVYNIIETADNAFFRDMLINWKIKGYYEWQSDGSTNSEILADLATDSSGLPDGIVIGFTRDANFTAGGKAYVYQNNPGTGYSVNYDQNVTSTTSAVRHEVGHNYGLGHDSDPTVCLMNYTYAYDIDFFDSAHEQTIESRDNWFGGKR